jgi:Asp-tRNA(Asn)/Glu-tRNA(Gln) amidotransferase B subunit
MWCSTTGAVPCSSPPRWSRRSAVELLNQDLVGELGVGLATSFFHQLTHKEALQLIEGGIISGKIAKEILPELLEQGGSAKAIVAERGLGMISDPAAITAIVEELLAAHPEEVEAFRGGKNKLQGFFVGQLMKKTGGKADPMLANQILIQKLNG